MQWTALQHVAGSSTCANPLRVTLAQMLHFEDCGICYGDLRAHLYAQHYTERRPQSSERR